MQIHLNLLVGQVEQARGRQRYTPEEHQHSIHDSQNSVMTTNLVDELITRTCAMKWM